MKRSRYVRSIAAILASLLLISASATVSVGSLPKDSSSGLPVKQITPRSDIVSIQQVTFVFDTGRLPDSDWGQIQVNPDKLREFTELPCGYLNVFLRTYAQSDLAWVVQNLSITAPVVESCAEDSQKPSTKLHSLLSDLRPKESKEKPIPHSTYFDLRPGFVGQGRVNKVDLIILVTPQVLPNVEGILQFVAGFRPLQFPVEQVEVNAEGDLGEGPSPPLDYVGDLVGPPPPPAPPPGPPTDLAFPITIFQASTPNVQCAKNQCVPMSHANNLQYLKNRYNILPLAWTFPELHIPGFGQMVSATTWQAVPTNSLVANIDALTRREDVQDADTGKGSGRCQNIQGFFGYVTAKGGLLQSAFRHQGGAQAYGAGATCDNGMLDNYVSQREGVNPTWEWIFGELVQGRGVEMSFGFYDSNGVRTGGHMLRIWGAAKFPGNKLYLFTLDDGNQGDNDLGLRTQQWPVADTGSPGNPGVPDGRLNLIGTSWEIEFAISTQAIPTLLIP
ncbi:MAG: hypothetical protein ACOZFS_07740 [Thermodesulfobacteriota bacterium]